MNSVRLLRGTAEGRPSTGGAHDSALSAGVGSWRVLEKAGSSFEARLRNWIGRPNMGEPAGDSLSFVVVRPVE
jgi:hypothetical protein